MEKGVFYNQKKNTEDKGGVVVGGERGGGRGRKLRRVGFQRVGDRREG